MTRRFGFISDVYLVFSCKLFNSIPDNLIYCDLDLLSDECCIFVICLTHGSFAITLYLIGSSDSQVSFTVVPFLLCCLYEFLIFSLSSADFLISFRSCFSEDTYATDTFVH